MAAIYARISLDRTGAGAGVARQIKECRALCARLGLTVGTVYEDNDISATTGVARPAFEQLLADRPSVIVAWHQDRLLRLTSDLERVISLDVPVHTVTAGTLDLATPAGRAVARTVAAWSTYETEQKATRQRAANDQRAETGQPHVCTRPFGYEADGMALRPAEATELRAAADGLIRGRSLLSMANDLNARGVLTSTGHTWRATTLRVALLRPRNAGQRQHRGAVIGPAAWPAILDADTAAAVRAILTDPARARRGPVRRYLLSGLLACGMCGEPLSGAWIKDRGHGVYRCPGHLSRSVEKVDEFVVGVTVARLAQPDAIGLFTRPGADTTPLRDEQAGLRQRLGGLAEAFAMGDIDRAQLAAGTRRLNGRLAELETALAASVVDPTLGALVTAEDVAAAFAALPQETQRKVIAALMALELLPVGSGRRPFNPAESLRITWGAGCA